MAVDPAGQNAAITAQRNFHTVAAIHHFETSVRSVHLVDSSKNCQMLDVLNVSVRIGVDMGVKSTCRTCKPPELALLRVNSRKILTTTSQLVVDLFFEQKHFLTRESVQYTGGTLPPKEAVEPVMGIGKILRAT